MSRDFVGALLQLNAEKGVPREHLIRTIEDAIESAYRRIPGNEDVRVRIDPERGEMMVTRERLVVEEIEDELTQITVGDAAAFKDDADPRRRRGDGAARAGRLRPHRRPDRQAGRAPAPP